jgi:NarL family two-component system response regulator LiaR
MGDIRPIRVLVVDDHAMVRTGLRQFLKGFQDLELAGEASNGAEAVELCQQAAPDVVLMDLVMPEMDGSQATRRIRQLCPEVKVIALTSFQEQDMVEQTLQAGAIGYLLKNVSAEELAGAIRAAHTGHPTLSQEAAEALVQATRQRPELGGDLSEREREVLELLVEGLSNGQIAEHLIISLATARYHVSSVLRKLGASSRAEAVSLAWQHHLVERK